MGVKGGIGRSIPLRFLRLTRYLVVAAVLFTVVFVLINVRNPDSSRGVDAGETNLTANETTLTANESAANQTTTAGEPVSIPLERPPFLDDSP